MVQLQSAEECATGQKCGFGDFGRDLSNYAYACVRCDAVFGIPQKKLRLLTECPCGWVRFSLSQHMKFPVDPDPYPHFSFPYFRLYTSCFCHQLQNDYECPELTPTCIFPAPCTFEMFVTVYIKYQSLNAAAFVLKCTFIELAII